MRVATKLVCCQEAALRWLGNTGVQGDIKSDADAKALVGVRAGVDGGQVD